mgnify:CR=1 FL=1
MKPANQTIIQWNIHGFYPNFEELRSLAHKHKPKVFCLQEIFVRETDKCGMRGYQSYHVSSYSADDRPIGGAAILVENSVSHRRIVLNTTLQAVAVRVSLIRTITICSIYLPPRYNFTYDELANLIRQIPSPFLILGDFNAHSPAWGCRSTNQAGGIIEDLMDKLDLCLLNDDQPTFLHPGNGALTAIDLSLCSPSLMLDLKWRVLGDQCGSDHFPLELKLTGQTPVQNQRRWVLRKANWEKYESIVEETIQEEVFTEVEDPISHLSELLIKAAMECVPSSSYGSYRVRRPWFDKECERAVRLRKTTLQRYKWHPDHEHRAIYIKARAEARKIIKQKKRESWKNYISKINARTSATQVWDMIRKITGRRMNRVANHLQEADGTLVEDAPDIANCLAKTIAHNSSTSHYNQKFQKHKQNVESRALSFHSRNNEVYNEAFSLGEFQHALRGSHDTAVGPDEIHYSFIKHLPVSVQSVVVDLFNRLWIGGSFPALWGMATVIPIAKPGKDPSIPGNYRPIALTSCLCKTLERMINNRLIWFMESRDLLTPFQSGFRRNRSTADHLISLETYVRNAMVAGEHVVSVFFDLEKAYDTTWKEGILRDLHEMGLRGRLPLFIKNFLSHRQFKVRVGSSLSDPQPQEMGVPQGSILSPTLFIVKINSIVKILKPHIHRTLFVDDFTISYRGRTTQSVQRQLQICLSGLERWCDLNGFKFSATKTVMVHFCMQRRMHDDPVLILNGQPVPLVEKVKFLGVWFDKKLNFKAHIDYVRGKCQKSLNLLRTLSHFNWGADRETLLHLFHAFVRSTLEYGSIVYGSARSSYLRKLETVQNQALRLCLGAFRTSPISSLHVEANELPMHLRRQQLSLQYAVKLKNDESNPTFNCVFNPERRNFFLSKPSYIRPFALRIEDALKILKANNIAGFHTSDVPPWKFRFPELDLTLTKYKKSECTPDFLRNEFYEILSRYSGVIYYTDGSKSHDAVACAAHCTSHQMQMSLPAQMSIYTAELVAIDSALAHIERDGDSDEYIICSDSLSCLTALCSPDFKNPYLLSILKKCTSLANRDKTIVFIWCPSHIGVGGNERADRLAKQALTMPGHALPVPYEDIRGLIRSLVKSEWQIEWDGETDNKLRVIQPTVGVSSTTLTNTRREEMVLTRARIGHTYFTHGHILRAELPPQCIPCNCSFTTRHILVECADFHYIRNKYYQVNSLRDLFERIQPSKIFQFLKEIGLFYRF